MNKQEKYVFNDKTQLICHITEQLNNPTLLKTQKALYLLWAFYSATYGNINYNDKNSEFYNQKDKYPLELFNANFVAWSYGPVILEVNDYFTNKEIVNVSYIPKTENEKDIMLFVNDILEQINMLDDFSLAIRTKKDLSWKNARKNQNNLQMNNFEVKNDYIKYVKE